ncbi:MAG TPA: hypothetical protein VMT53_16600 [Terriglobales bacterium]|nr:hypothetical protein [Terriglobales bacterium]
MTARELSEQLGLREFLALCAVVDKSRAPGTRFEVVKIRRDSESGVIHCLVLYTDALIDRVDVPMLSIQAQRKTAPHEEAVSA